MQFNRFSRNNGSEVLNNEALRRFSPSVFAETPHHSRGERYGFIPTIQVLDALRSEGWQPHNAREQTVRLDDRRGFTRHIVRMRQPGLAFDKVGDTLPELVLLNSHDGTSAYQMHVGLFRLACLNGLVVSDTTFAKISVRHSGNVVDRVLEGAATVVRDVPQIAAHVGVMRSLQLSRPEQEAFAGAALLTKYESPEAAPIDAEQLLGTRRTADASQDLWTTFNRVQENLLRGGLRGQTATGKRTRTREVKSITEDTRINKALWQLTEQMRKLKEAA
jgi:hypothetical protein